MTPKATLMSRKTGAMGTGVMENAALGNSGPMKFDFGGEKYNGKWIAVRDTGSTSFRLLTTYGGGLMASNASSQADSGFGTALLSAESGKSMRCEFKYSLVTITAVGVCEKNDGEIIDLQLAL